MKPVVLSIVALLVSAHSQSNAQALKSYGAKVAVTSSDVEFNYAHFSGIDTKRRVGIGAALYLEWLAHPNIAIITQFEYSQRGMGTVWARTDIDPTVLETVTFYDRLDYFSIPVLGKFSVPIGWLQPYALLGPRVDFLIGKKINAPGFDAVFNEFKKSIFGGTLGIGSEFDWGLQVNFVIEVRYNFDITNSYATENLTVRHNAFDVWLGVSI